MAMELRVLREADWDRWYDTVLLAWGGVPEPPGVRSLWGELASVERSIGAWEDGETIGTASAFAFRLSVPGGALVPAAGVSLVSVRPTHRRRGVLTAMMRRQLEGIRAWGEPLAVLTASEQAIYGRFGYGVATHSIRASIDTARVHVSVPHDTRVSQGANGTAGVRLRLSKPGEARDACEAVYARRVATRPGMLARARGWEALPLLDPAEERAGASPLQCVLAEVAGETVGYARYAVRPSSDESGPNGTVILRDLEALSPGVYAALWEFLFGLDLTTRLEADARPVDDPLLQLVNDLRPCRLGVRDGLHLRLVEVGAALSARTYRAPVDVVFEVEDAFCPWNAGRWRLTGDAKGASCRRTGDRADLALSVGELGAAYLGGVSLTALAGAGRVRELREGALAEASLAFDSEVAPWLPHSF